MLDSDEDIISAIARFSQVKILWIDTETSNYKTRNPQLSLIQVLDDCGDFTGEQTLVLDVLNSPAVIENFAKEIICNPAIEKVFHNASYDLKFFGKQAVNVTCTLEMAKKIPYYLALFPNFSLKTLVEHLCNITIDKSEQNSDWGQRPLSDRQMKYAKMDPVYLAMVHQKLLQLQALSNPDPETEDVAALAQRYLELKQQLQIVDSEVTHVETRLKAAMQVQNLPEINELKLLQSKRTTVKVTFADLAKVAELHQLQLNFPITLTQKLQKELKDIIDELPQEVETNTIWQLKVKESD